MSEIKEALDKAISDLNKIHERYRRVSTRLLKGWAEDPGEGDWQETRRRILEDE